MAGEVQTTCTHCLSHERAEGLIELRGLHDMSLLVPEPSDLGAVPACLPACLHLADVVDVMPALPPFLSLETRTAVLFVLCLLMSAMGEDVGVTDWARRVCGGATHRHTRWASEWLPAWTDRHLYSCVRVCVWVRGD
mmetsp:Transcript_28262/g.81442  ORF Transcript_28262/g.81442 Transcript_28262/m.81442 type:complete len:137 (-) Transcript_28262:829-1239(-)